MLSKDEIIRWIFSTEILSPNQREYLAKIDPEIIEQNFSVIPDHIKFQYYKIFLANSDIQFRLYNDVWIPYLKIKSNNWEPTHNICWEGSTLYDIYKIVSLVEDVPPVEEMFDRVYKHLGGLSYLSTDPTLLYYFAVECFKKTPEVWMDKVRSFEFKSWGMTGRSEMFNAAIVTKNIDIKMVRKIRSESSEGVCKRSTKFLLKNSNLYTFEEMKELMMQFVDLKHEETQYLLAKEVDPRLIPYFLGFTSQHAKKELERRLAIGAGK